MLKKIVILLLALGMFGTVHAQEKRVEIPVGNSPSMGPTDAPVTIIEFIDFQ